MYPTVTLLIATYNWPDSLKAVLTTVMSQTVQPSQIVIADDGSTDETRLLIEEFSSIMKMPLLHVWHEDLGFRKTIILNKALAVCKGDYIIQIDGDILLHPRFIEDHISEARPGYFIRGSRALLAEDFSKHLLSNHLKPSPKTLNQGVKKRINSLRSPLIALFYCRKSNNVRRVKGCNMAYWRSDVLLVNGYNNNMVGWGHEDVELSARLYNSGIKIRRVKFKAICYHLFHSSSTATEEGINFELYEKALREKLVFCENGIECKEKK